MTRFRFIGALAAVLASALLVGGCGTVEHRVSIEKHYVVQPGTKVEVGAVKNQTGKDFDVDVQKMLYDALAKALADRNLQWKGDAGPKLVLSADIVEYEAGDAFKRWLMPGWGATVLVVKGTLVDAENRTAGSVEAKRTVEAGGGYTIGAWESVFGDVANDIVTKLGEQLK
jgi:hypothetical protein